MKISIFYDHLEEAMRQSELTLDEILKMAGTLGITGIDISLNTLLLKKEELLPLLIANSMCISSIIGIFDWAKEGNNSRAEDICAGYQLIDTAARFGVRTVLVVPGLLSQEETILLQKGDLAAIHGVSRIKNILQSVVTYSETRGVTVTLEDYDSKSSPYSTPEQLRWFFSEIAGLRLTFDTGNFIFNGDDAKEEYQHFKKLISHVHLKDRIVTSQGLLPAAFGNGNLPVRGLVQQMLSDGYDGFLTIEHYDVVNQLDAMRTSVFNLKHANRSEGETVKITIWNEYLHELEYAGIRAVYPEGIHGALCDTLSKMPENPVIRVATLAMPECGLSEEILSDTDVLLWWGHAAHERVPDEVARRVQKHVLKGMGFLPLHSAHMSKPLRLLLGTDMTLRWKNDATEVLHVLDTTHPITRGIPQRIRLEHEEMYSEPFMIPSPDELIFGGGFPNGEIFRSGCVWKRGNGKIFYFQPGHEEYPIYYDETIQHILANAVRYLMPVNRRTSDASCEEVK